MLPFPTHEDLDLWCNDFTRDWFDGYLFEFSCADIAIIQPDFWKYIISKTHMLTGMPRSLACKDIVKSFDPAKTSYIGWSYIQSYVDETWDYIGQSWDAGVSILPYYRKSTFETVIKSFRGQYHDAQMCYKMFNLMTTIDMELL